MLILSYLGEAKKFDLTEGRNLLIVRDPPDIIPEHFTHVPQLSPSRELRQSTQVWKQEYGRKEDWWILYESRFLKEIRERRDMERALDRLEKLLKDGELVRAFCFCKDVWHCHRQYIGKEMERRGCEVDYRPVPVIEQLSLF